MARLKIAVIGAGSFVFGPSMLQQAILDHRLQDVELALVDADAEMVVLMAGVGRHMAQQADVHISISAHTSHAEALDGTDFVICSVARQGFKRCLPGSTRRYDTMLPIRILALIESDGPPPYAANTAFEQLAM